MKSRLSQMREKPPRLSVSGLPADERPIVSRARTALEQGVDVRRTVPSLLTWILKGPRRAMKRFLTLYDQHLRRIGLVTLDAVKEIDAETIRERAALTERLSAQEDELDLMKRELKETRQRLASMEIELGKPTAHSEETVAERASDDRPVPRKNGSA